MYKAITVLFVGLLLTSCSLIHKKNTYNLGIFLQTISGTSMTIALKSNGTVVFKEKFREDDSRNRKYTLKYLMKDNKIITYSVIKPNDDEQYNLIEGVGYIDGKALMYTETSSQYGNAILPENCDQKTFNEIHTGLSSVVEFLKFPLALSFWKITGSIIGLLFIIGLFKKKTPE